MSKFPFLDNAHQGKNSATRYLTTIIIIIIPNVLLLFSLYSILGVSYSTNLEDFNSSINNNLIPLAISISTVFFLFVLTHFIHKRNPLTLITSYKKIKWSNILKGATLWILILIVISAVAFIIYPTKMNLNFNSNLERVLLLLTAFMAITTTGFAAEVYTRGYFMQAFSLISRKPIVPLLITSVLFGIGPTNYILHLFVFNLMLGIIVIGNGGLETAIGIHVINSLFFFLLCGFTPDSIDQIVLSPFMDCFMFLACFVAPLLMLTILFWDRPEDLKEIFRLKST